MAAATQLHAYFHLVSELSPSLVLDVNDNGGVVVNRCVGGDTQLFRVDDCGRLVTRSGLAVTAVGDGARLQLRALPVATVDNSNAVEFHKDLTVHLPRRRLCLEVFRNGTLPGTRVCAAPFHGYSNQQWKESSCVRYGERITLKHEDTRGFLSSYARNYCGGSCQQEVACVLRPEQAHSVWIVKPRNNAAEALFGTPVKSGDSFRLEHEATQRNLHSQQAYSPITQQQEVSCFGDSGHGDLNCDWRVECGEVGDPWLPGFAVKLYHNSSGQVLHSHQDQLHPGLLEVTCSNDRESSDFWRVTSRETGTRITNDAHTAGEYFVICADAGRLSDCVVDVSENGDLVMAPFNGNDCQWFEIRKGRITSRSGETLFVAPEGGKFVAKAAKEPPEGCRWTWTLQTDGSVRLDQQPSSCLTVCNDNRVCFEAAQGLPKEHWKLWSFSAAHNCDVITYVPGTCKFSSLVEAQAAALCSPCCLAITQEDNKTFTLRVGHQRHGAPASASSRGTTSWFKRPFYLDGSYEPGYPPPRRPSCGDALRHFLLVEHAPHIWLALHPRKEQEPYRPASVEWSFQIMERFRNSDNKFWLRVQEAVVSPFDAHNEVFHGPKDLGDVPVYGFFVHTSDNEVSLVYSCWFPYHCGDNVDNRKRRVHVGDWQCCIVKLKNGVPAELCTCTNEDGVTWRCCDFLEAERHGGHPVIYCAWGTHGTSAGAASGACIGCGELWETERNVAGFNYNGRRGLGRPWPAWMSREFSNAGGGDEHVPGNGPIFRWGDPARCGDGATLADGPEGPASTLAAWFPTC
eukprot:TRINITY_DN18365_c0_g1_i1.p1 TRINITY_DN18365_c0_g1~~TRINITY_DN18365_c0_g1_i1.p1  ORF type:complete len:820 (-),score=98.60 TRINITY_DN18365_c0_g1_i1:133-2526(-)